jgi:predicted DNA-binding transcriptional regulator YafY
MEADTSERNFDRDIEDIRIYLSEMYQTEELLYDRKDNNYYLSGVRREDLEIIEYQFLEHLLMESKVLRRDELEGILCKLASNTKNINKYSRQSTALLDNYEDMHTAPLLKMHGDIEMVIRNKDVIDIRYLSDKDYTKKVVIPCNIIYEDGHTYLVAIEYTDEENTEYGTLGEISYYEMRKIESFKIIRNQNTREQKRVMEYFAERKKGKK